MLLSSFVFSGQTAYLATAADQLGQPELARGAGRLVALTALANLCAQASRAKPADAALILANAVEFRDQLAIALQAADAMLLDVGSAVRLAAESVRKAAVSPDPELPVPPVGPPPRHQRKGGRS